MRPGPSAYSTNSKFGAWRDGNSVHLLRRTVLREASMARSALLYAQFMRAFSIAIEPWTSAATELDGIT